MEKLNSPSYPKGTTKEQWDKYELDLKHFKKVMELKKPKSPIKELYRQRILGVDTEYFRDDLYNEAMDNYKKELSAWEMKLSCDAPNEPGYYRANND